jgi:hypothetical protein
VRRQAKEKEVKLYHTAALALVGWYLMMPPATRGWFSATTTHNDSAPLSQWTTLRSFDTSLECQTYLGRDDSTWQDAETRRFNRFLSERKQSSGKVTPWDQILAERRGEMDHARCIATDDPRLKGN